MPIESIQDILNDMRDRARREREGNGSTSGYAIGTMLRQFANRIDTATSRECDRCFINHMTADDSPDELTKDEKVSTSRAHSDSVTTGVETVEDVVSEMSNARKFDKDIQDWADRIDAAHKREEAVTDALLACKGKIFPHPDPDHAPLPAAKFDKEAFDKAISSRPNGWDAVADPMAEIRRMRGDVLEGNVGVMREALLSVRKSIDYRGGDLVRYTLPVIDAALKTPPEPAGNAAMMRMALEVLWDVIGQFSNNILDGQMQLVLSDMLIPAKNAYHHALTVPPRNCDRFVRLGDISMYDSPIDSTLVTATREEMLKFIRWLMAPTESSNKQEGGAK